MNTDKLPAWINWIAQDKNGSVWGFEAEPHRHDNGWYENEIGRYVILFEAETSDLWANSLIARAEVLSNTLDE